MSRLVGFYFPNILSRRGGRLQGVNHGFRDQQVRREAVVAAAPQLAIYSTLGPDIISLHSHTPERLCIPHSAWEPDTMRISKQTNSIVPVSAVTGGWSASHDTESDDKMGRDNGKLTRAGITPDLARSITAGLNFRQALNQFREWNWKSLHQNWLVNTIQPCLKSRSITCYFGR